MDLRSIINPDASAGAAQSRLSTSQQSPKQSAAELAPGYRAIHTSPGAPHNVRPPQHPPLQPGPPFPDFRSPAPLHHAPSPVRVSPGSAISGAQYPFPHHPIQSPVQTRPSQAYFGAASSSTPSSQTSHQQVQTPHSPYPPALSSSVPRYLHNQQPTSHPSLSPSPSATLSLTSLQQSQPVTPLGPPISYHRTSTHPQRDVPSPLSHHRTYSGASFASAPSPAQPSQMSISRLTESPVLYEQRHHPPHAGDGENFYRTDRERSLSVSPKTKIPSRQHSLESQPTSQDLPQRSVGNLQQYEHQFIQPPLKETNRNGADFAPDRRSILGEPPVQPASELGLPPLSSTRCDTHSNPFLASSLKAQLPSGVQGYNTERRSSIRPAILTTEASVAGVPSSALYSSLSVNDSTSPGPPDRSVSGHTDQDGNTTRSLKRDIDAFTEPGMQPSNMPIKRRRLPGPPIWATRYEGNGMTPAQRSLAARIPETQKPFNPVRAAQSSKPAPLTQASRPMGPPVTNGAHSVGPATAQGAQPVLGPLGPWEVNIENVIPLDEITKTVCDFFFTHVVASEIATGTAGSVPSSLGQLEVEAKIGKLINKDTERRLWIGCCTETIIDRGFPVSFESSMTEHQHAIYNNFLNEAVKKAHQANRIPIKYKHTHETDTFYELSRQHLASLPPAIRAHINPNHNIKVRVTTDQRSGKVLAQIIKVRLADLSVHSPQSEFDWRISINLEMNYDGSIEGLVPASFEPGPGTGGPGPLAGGSAPRNKDRMSYRHLEYQIDLTQVTMGGSRSAGKGAQGRGEEKVHELEVEVSGDALRRTGKLVMAGESEPFEAVVKGLLDNVRSLVRRFPRERP